MVIPSYGNEAAFPQPQIETPDGRIVLPTQFGLTKIELFAAMAMHGYCSSEPSQTPEVVAKWSVDNARALIAELSKPVS